MMRKQSKNQRLMRLIESFSLCIYRTSSFGRFRWLTVEQLPEHDSALLLAFLKREKFIFKIEGGIQVALV